MLLMLKMKVQGLMFDQKKFYGRRGFD